MRGKEANSEIVKEPKVDWIYWFHRFSTPSGRNAANSETSPYPPNQLALRIDLTRTVSVFSREQPKAKGAQLFKVKQFFDACQTKQQSQARNRFPGFEVGNVCHLPIIFIMKSELMENIG